MVKIKGQILFSLFFLVNILYSANNAEEYFTIGVKEYNIGNYYQAMYNFIEALKVDPYHIKAKKYIRKTKVALEKLQKAPIEIPQKELPANPYTRKKELTEEEKQIKIQTLLQKAQLALQKKNFRTAKTSYQQILALDSTNISAQEGLTKVEKEEHLHRLNLDGKTFMRRDRWFESYEAYQEVLKIDPENTIAKEGLENLRRRLAERLKKAKYLSPKERFCIEGLMQYIENNYSQAVHSWEKALITESLTETYIIDTKKLEEYLAMAKLQAEEEQKKKIEEERQKQLEAHLSTGQELFKKKKYKDAITEFEQVLKLDPENTLAKEYLVKCNLEIEKQKATKRIIPAEVNIEPILQEGIKLYNQADYSRAIERFEHVLKYNPDNITAKKYLIDAKAQLAKLRDPKVIEEHYKQGLVYYSQGQYEAAMKEFEIVLRLDPTHERAKNAYEKVKQDIESAKKK